jgi:hypothetical protein
MDASRYYNVSRYIYFNDMFYEIEGVTHIYIRFDFILYAYGNDHKSRTRINLHPIYKYKMTIVEGHGLCSLVYHTILFCLILVLCITYFHNIVSM